MSKKSDSIAAKLEEMCDQLETSSLVQARVFRCRYRDNMQPVQIAAHLAIPPHRVTVELSAAVNSVLALTMGEAFDQWNMPEDSATPCGVSANAGDDKHPEVDAGIGIANRPAYLELLAAEPEADEEEQETQSNEEDKPPTVRSGGAKAKA